MDVIAEAIGSVRDVSIITKDYYTLETKSILRALLYKGVETIECADDIEVISLANLMQEVLPNLRAPVTYVQKLRKAAVIADAEVLRRASTGIYAKPRVVRSYSFTPHIVLSLVDELLKQNEDTAEESLAKELLSAIPEAISSKYASEASVTLQCLLSLKDMLL